MKDYKIFEFEDDINHNVAFINTTEDLYFIKDYIYDELSKVNGNEFEILVDLFLRNGFSFNRFVLLKYKGKEKCKTLIVNPTNVSEQIKMKIKEYLKNNENILQHSALSKETIEFVKQ